MVTPTGYTRSGEMSTPCVSAPKLSFQLFVGFCYRVTERVPSLDGPLE